MEKTNPLSVAASCIFMWYKAASPLKGIAFVLSCIFLSWIITLQDLFSSFTFLLQAIFRVLSLVWKCLISLIPLRVSRIPIRTSDSFWDTSVNNECVVKSEDYLLREEVELVMEKLGIFLNPNDDKLQKNIGCREISGLFDENEPSLDEVKEAFDLFDENGDGYIDSKELKKIICNFGFVEASEDECLRMIKTFDDDGDSRINLGEFVKLLRETFSS